MDRTEGSATDAADAETARAAYALFAACGLEKPVVLRYRSTDACKGALKQWMDLRYGGLMPARAVYRWWWVAVATCGFAIALVIGKPGGMGLDPGVDILAEAIGVLCFSSVILTVVWKRWSLQAFAKQAGVPAGAMRFDESARVLGEKVVLEMDGMDPVYMHHSATPKVRAVCMFGQRIQEQELGSECLDLSVIDDIEAALPLQPYRRIGLLALRLQRCTERAYVYGNTVFAVPLEGCQ